jgi:hypothetical protein
MSIIKIITAYNSTFKTVGDLSAKYIEKYCLQNKIDYSIIHIVENFDRHPANQ